MQMQFNTGVCTLILEKLPDNVIDVDLVYTPKELELRGITKEGGWWYSGPITRGYVKIGLSHELTEEQFQPLVEYCEEGHFYKAEFKEWTKYVDYTSEDKEGFFKFPFDTARESFDSLLRHLKIRDDNEIFAVLRLEE